ncbi:hypothetical protein BGZ49_009610 [Haplosporangium sp. Z 27]|nr:hypothetical protein BGZ49_009610 [Haplosporangium sp. Z 27]
MSPEVLKRVVYGSLALRPTFWFDSLRQSVPIPFATFLSALVARIEEKVFLIAMSGFINARMEGANDIFGESIISAVNESCHLPHAHVPSSELQLILEPLRIAFNVGRESGLLDQVEELIEDDARARKAKEETPQTRARVLDIIRYL